MKIVFMGTPDFAVGALEAIVQAGHEVTCVVTQPDKPKGRGKEMQYTPVKECARKYQIPVFQPMKIKQPEEIAVLRSYEADIYVVAAFGQILSQEILDIPRFGCVNIHASLLPKYRGAAPIQRALIDGEKETGVTIMQMNAGLDTGDMLTKTVVPILDTDTGESLHDKLSAAGAELIVKTLPMIEAGEVIPEKQDDTQSTYAKMLNKSMGRIDWSRPAVEIERLVRGLNSWPSAYTSFHGKNLKIWESRIAREAENGTNAEPGCVVWVDKESFTVQTGEGALCITNVQIEGKKRMPVKDFLLGYKIETGEKLGV
ncbi:MAG: methionyl-tRNA formyltransferase [Lachnospiraceae bacterium]|nr:methionyl-tRNA formyltransferase [Lachnospiraceae bacterium]